MDYIIIGATFKGLVEACSSKGDIPTDIAVELCDLANCLADNFDHDKSFNRDKFLEDCDLTT